MVRKNGNLRTAQQKMKPVFQVGDRVLLSYDSRKVTGLVVEDRGLLGRGGRRLYHVEVPADPAEPMLLLMGEDELEIDPGEWNAPIDKSRIMDYLKRSGLVSMLLANSPRGKTQPRAWIRRDSYGNRTTTFDPDWGVIGGATVPYGTLHANWKVREARKDAAKSFLASFGLTPEEAEEVFAAMGTKS